MDGYEATRRIRASGLPGTDIPIIAMTASVFREDIQRCLASGMNSHLGKPINIDEVIARLQEYLI
jgi:CheY-like chemotaxis protein